jgi:single-stranded-DNA-specific exonuclease
MKKTRTWSVRAGEPALERQFCAELSVRPLTARVLHNRGIRSVEEGRRFLEADLKGLESGDGFPDMTRAVGRLLHALETQEQVIVYGDYDVDGLSGACLLYHLLRHIGAQVDVYIPDRLRDGYGLGGRGLQQMLERRPGVVVTVDHGITAYQSIATLQEAGIDVIVTDHHQKPEQLPEAYAILNPLLLDEAHPLQGLAGAGVAFKLACGVFMALPAEKRRQTKLRDVLRECLSFAALGTVADVVPLRRENRLLVRHGLQRLQETIAPGLRALREQAGLRGTLDAEDIAFFLAPRLNAAGRMGQVDKSRRLLMTTSSEEARELARDLEALNLQRRELEAGVLQRARKLADQQPADHPILCLGDPAFHAGVMGIVAARLMEEHEKPVVLVSMEEDSARGSGRAPRGFDLGKAFRGVSHVLRSHGGHAAAAGLEMDPARVPELQEALVEYASAQEKDPIPPTINIDSEVQLHQLDPRLVWELSRVGPFGEGNPKPLFAVSQVEQVAEPRCVGKDESHLLLKLRYREGSISAIAFGMGHRRQEALGEALDLAFTPRSSTYRGSGALELLVRDLRSRP